MNISTLNMNSEIPTTVFSFVNRNVNIIPTYDSPVRSTTEPVAPWAPPSQGIRRTLSADANAINLSANFEREFEEDEFIRRMDSLVFPDMDTDDLDNSMYQEHYTIPEEQLYGDVDDIDIVPHPNITLFRGENPDRSDDEEMIFDLDQEGDEDTIIPTYVDQVQTDFDEYEYDDEGDTVITEENCPSINVKDEEATHSTQCRFVKMDYLETQSTYPIPCAVCKRTMKYHTVYETNCEHALCCHCWISHETRSDERYEYAYDEFIMCPIPSCRKTIRNTTAYVVKPDM